MSAARFASPSQPSALATPASAAQARLEQSRAKMAQWLSADMARRAHPSAAGAALRGAWSVLEDLRPTTGTALVLGALTQAWLRSQPQGGRFQQTPQPLTMAATLARRHPKTALATAVIAGLALWWYGHSGPRPLTR